MRESGVRRRAVREVERGVVVCVVSERRKLQAHYRGSTAKACVTAQPRHARPSIGRGRGGQCPPCAAYSVVCMAAVGTQCAGVGREAAR